MQINRFTLSNSTRFDRPNPNSQSIDGDIISDFYKRITIYNVWHLNYLKFPYSIVQTNEKTEIRFSLQLSTREH